MKKLLTIYLILLLISFCSCSSAAIREYDPAKEYKYDLKITNVGNVFRGLALFQYKDFYTFYFESKGRLNYVSFVSCSRDVNLENAGSGVFKQKKFKISIHPDEIEKGEFCDIKIQTFEKRNKNHTSGYIVIAWDFFKLPSVVVCNGKTIHYEGSSICENRVNNYIKIKFKETVRVSTDKDCPLPKDKFSEILFSTKPGICSYVFKGSSGKLHKLVVHGYELPAIRE